MSATFWTLAALFCGVAILTLFVPVWLHKKRGGRWSFAGIAASVLIAPLALGLYSLVTNWNPELADRVAQENALLLQVEQHLQSNPNDAQGWQLLAASYMQLGRYDEASAAYARLWALTPQPDDDLKIAYAESQILADRSSLTGDAGRLIEEVLASRPNDPKALWYGGHVALQLGREDDVRARWSRLLTMRIPDEVAQVVQAQLAELNGAGAQAAEPAPVGPEIKLSVTLGEGRSLTALAPTAQLFVMALAPEGTRRHQSHWRSGFYQVALQADVPLALAFFDYGERRVGVDSFIRLSGDAERDMALIAGRLARRRGRKPQLAAPVRLPGA